MTLDGEELLIPLDGQHRLAALKFAITGKDEKDKPIQGIDGASDLARDMCSIILIRDNVDKSRKIFNKVNRYAKPTSKNDNLITGDDDICAVISRESIATDLIGSRIVKMNAGNTLPKAAFEFTTLATLYEISKSVLEAEIGQKLNTQSLPPEADRLLYKELLIDFWQKFLTITAYEVSIADREDTGDLRRQETREGQLHCRPIIMRVLAGAYIRMTNVAEGEPRINLETFVSRVNDLDWSPDNRLWNGVMMVGSKIITGPTAMNIASRYVSYILGGAFEGYEEEQLKEALEGIGVNRLPERLY